MPPGDYELEARYAADVGDMWKGELLTTARIRIGDDNDPQEKVTDIPQVNK